MLPAFPGKAAGSLSNKGSANETHDYHMAILLSDGKVLVAGGY